MVEEKPTETSNTGPATTAANIHSILQQEDLIIFTWTLSDHCPSLKKSNIYSLLLIDLYVGQMLSQ